MKRVLTCLFLWLTSLSLWAQYNPSNPPEPGQYYTLTLLVTPSGGGSVSPASVSTRQSGNFVRLSATANTNFQFVAWAENGVIISQTAQFDYQMPAKDVTLTAHFDYVPSNPSEPSTPNIPVYSTVYVTCNPADGGSFSGVTSGNRYQQGASLSLSASAKNNFQFAYWTEEGEVISTASSFKYVVKTYDTHLVAHFSYNPSNPSEPPVLQPTHKLYISANPSAGGSFSPSSGSNYQPGTAVSVSATAKSGYTFSHWTENDSVIATTASFTYTMPNHDVALQVHFTENAYNPSNPAEPGEASGERHNIFGRTENAWRGQTIYYPVWLENSTSVMNMYIDLTFPDIFVVDTANARLSSRVGNHWLEKIWIEGNTWRMRIRGQDVLIGNNGPVMEIPVTIPEDAPMGKNYLVALTHGVVMRPDSTQVPIGVRSGNIYVQRLYEDDLFASFTFDKYQTRVGFRNMSAGRIQSVMWDFGDGQTSTEYSPLHVYENPGSYTVRLTIQGETEEDVMETSIYLNDQSTWKAEGSFQIDTTIVSARNFSSFEELISTLLKADVTGNIVINILSGLQLDYSLTEQNRSNLISLYNKVQQAGYSITFRQSGAGLAPVLNMGTAQQHSLDAMQQFFKTLDAVNWQNIETHLYEVWFDFAEWKMLKRQIVSQGDKTKQIDFTRIAPALSYSWQQSPVSEVIFGAPVQGSRQLPSMLLVNEGEGANDLIFAVSASLHGNEFCRFTHTITVAPALVGLFNDLTPANHALLDATAFTISWNRILNAQYDLYLWDSVNPPSTQPVLHNSEALQYASSGFFQYGHSYKWVVVATNGAQQVTSDTMSFSIRQLPDLHVTSLHCNSAQAEGKLTVSWDVRNDGLGHTGAQQWKDRVWLVMDAYIGTSITGAVSPTLLAEVDNVKALAPEESYSRTLEITLPKHIYGEVYILVAADMYNVEAIEWSAIGGAVANPYQPSHTGSGYRYLYAKTNASYNLVYEEDETPTHSDNFFYTKIQLEMPPVPDLQIAQVIAEPLSLEEYMLSDGIKADLSAEFLPTPLTNAGLAYTKEWYSGKRVKVVATIVNRGSAPITNQTWRNGLWIANSIDRNDAEMVWLSSSTTSNKTLAQNESIQVTFYANTPYDWSGNTVFHVMADVDDNINEFANTENNWWHTDTIVMMRTPGADFVPLDLQVPSQLVSDQNFEIKYRVQNREGGVPYNSPWTDKVWLSTSPDGLDQNAVCIATFQQAGFYQSTVKFGPDAAGKGLLPAKYFRYEGADYTVSKTIKAGNIPSGKYYLYVQVDAENKVDETEQGERNNIIRSDTIRFVEPDLVITQFTMSRDTLISGDEVALSWTVQNNGRADLHNGQSYDKLYATINQDGSDAVLVTTLQNDLSIPVGGSKTLRANVTVPQALQLDGVRYFFLDVNSRRTIKESNIANNRSSLIKKVCVYTEEERIPPVVGPAVAVSDVNAPVELYADSTGVVIFRLSNVGDKRIEQDITKEIFLSTSFDFSYSSAIPLPAVSIEGSTEGLRPGASVMVTIRFRVPADVLSAQYNLHIRCDRTNKIKSKSTARNNANKKVLVLGKLPDPVLGVSVQDTVYTSQPDTVHFTWKNIGTWPVSAFTTQIVISKSVDYSYSDNSNVRLDKVTCPRIAPGEEYTLQTILKISDKRAGKWYIHFVSDFGMSVFMSDSAKTYSKGIVAELSPVSDLTVASIEAPSIWVAGEPVTIAYTVKNSSDIATRQSKWADDFWLSPSSKLDTKNATQLGSRTHSGILNPEQSYSASVSYNIPSTMHGNYMLYLRTDAANAMVESDEDNNFKAIPIYIRDANDHPADLVVSNMSVSDVIFAGEPIEITYTITNVGEFEANGNLRDIFYLSEDNQWNTQDNMVGVVSGDIRLRPGESLTRTATGVINSSIADTYYLLVRTNSTRAISESNYENNVTTTSSPIQFDYRSLEIGAEQIINATAMRKMIVQEGSNQSVVVRLSHPMGAAAGLYVSYSAAPSTSRNTWHSAKLQTNQQEVVLSNLAAGTYYILAQDNETDLPEEYTFSLSGWNQPQGASMTLKAEMVNFGATSLDRTQGGNGGWVTTNINGALFDSVMDFRLVSNATTLPAEVVTWDGGSQSFVTFNLNEVAEGMYSIVSERADGLQGTLESAFEVVEGRTFALNLKLDMPSLFRSNAPFPFIFSYANGGTTDVELSEMRISVEGGNISLSMEELLTNGQPTVIYKPHSESNARGYVSIPPGEQGIVNMYCMPLATSITVYVFILK